MTVWEEEIRLIDNLGLLYPKVPGWWVYNKNWENKSKAWWVCVLCIDHLNQRLPQLEEFIEWYVGDCWWEEYKEHFSIK